MPLEHSLTCHEKEESLWKEGQLLSLFGLICEIDGCVPGTEEDAQSYLEDERSYLETRFSGRSQSNHLKHYSRYKESKELSKFSSWCLIRILTACREISLLHLAFGRGSSYRKGSKFPLCLGYGLGYTQWLGCLCLVQCWYLGVFAGFYSQNACWQALDWF